MEGEEGERSEVLDGWIAIDGGKGDSARVGDRRRDFGTWALGALEP
jgi:hypothetical protein